MDINAILFQKMGIILHRCLVEARNLALSQRSQQVYDLADAFEILPALLVRWEDKHKAVVRNVLENYQSRYKDTAYDYLAILNMDDDAFRDVYIISPTGPFCP